ncbi:STM4011 family radical SAM protein [Prosthecobacter sp.]|uniref:STM4011 family radical SAM protein n=1 Tax=Prosthecobacter sp. TaxID=1965333 RepID=UPI0037839CBD
MMNPRWSILYRGPLSSCNYGCDYCPFAKTRNTRAELAHDAECLKRFCDWVESRPEQIGFLFTPWGEAMIHRHYQEALCRLSHMANVWRVAVQTNLAFPVESLSGCKRETAALWTTYHPTETTIPRFTAKCAALREAGIRHSVGIVGKREAFDDIHALRAALPKETYLWINAWKREKDYYSQEELAMLRGIDPHFDFNVVPHASLGRACRAGHSAFTVDGSGDARRCHFIPTVIGNIYDANFAQALLPRPCSIGECRCHIGYVSLEHLRLETVYGDGVLERIPLNFGFSSMASKA